MGALTEQTRRLKRDRELLQKRKDWVLDEGFGAGKYVKFANPPPTPTTSVIMSDQEEEERDDDLGYGLFDMMSAEEIEQMKRARKTIPRNDPPLDHQPRSGHLPKFTPQSGRQPLPPKVKPEQPVEEWLKDLLQLYGFEERAPMERDWLTFLRAFPHRTKAITEFILHFIVTTPTIEDNTLASFKEEIESYRNKDDHNLQDILHLDDFLLGGSDYVLEGEPSPGDPENLPRNLHWVVLLDR